MKISHCTPSLYGLKVVLNNMFQKIQCFQQKQCLLLINEMKIRPSIAYSGGVLSWKAKNKPEAKATSILAIMVKYLHGGLSMMVSITPVHKLDSAY